MRFRDLHEALRLEILRRLDLGLLTGSELARLTGFRQAHISNFLHAKRSLSLTGLDRVLVAINLTVDDVLPGHQPTELPAIRASSSESFPGSASIPDGGSFMDTPASPAIPVGARRNEDIALDLLKFVAASTGLGRIGPASTGFTATSPAKTDDQIAHLLDLYGRCLKTVEGTPGTGR
jgi:transcriptional regulator with XRE-family HTH domain